MGCSHGRKRMSPMSLPVVLRSCKDGTTQQSVPFLRCLQLAQLSYRAQSPYSEEVLRQINPLKEDLLSLDKVLYCLGLGPTAIHTPHDQREITFQTLRHKYRLAFEGLAPALQNFRRLTRPLSVNDPPDAVKRDVIWSAYDLRITAANLLRAHRLASIYRVGPIC